MGVNLLLIARNRNDWTVLVLAAVLAAELTAGTKAPIPFDKLAEADARKVRAVVEHRSFHRRLKKVEFTGTAAVYGFLLERMVFAADAIRALKLQDYEVKDNGDGTYTADDGAGATGVFSIVHKEDGSLVFYALGRYKGTFLRIRGRAVAIVQFEELPLSKMQNSVHIYFRFDNVVVSTMVRIISPFIGPMIDRKISYFLDAVRQLCRMIVENPEKVYAALVKSEAVEPGHLAEFKALFVDTQQTVEK